VYCYPNHDFAARRKIWGNFIDLARKNPKIRVDMGEEGIDRLAELPFNGRQVSHLSGSSPVMTLINCSRLRMR
jgi:hypothetical protein